jgi:hypothetical protein
LLGFATVSLWELLYDVEGKKLVGRGTFHKVMANTNADVNKTDISTAEQT